VKTQGKGGCTKNSTKMSSNEVPGNWKSKGPRQARPLGITKMKVKEEGRRATLTRRKCAKGTRTPGRFNPSRGGKVTVKRGSRGSRGSSHAGAGRKDVQS